MLSPPAVDRLKNAPISELVITNSLPVNGDASHLDMLTVLSIGPILAGAVNAIFVDASVSEIFQGEQITVGPGFFPIMAGPLALFLLFLTGVGPLIEALSRI